VEWQHEDLVGFESNGGERLFRVRFLAGHATACMEDEHLHRLGRVQQERVLVRRPRPCVCRRREGMLEVAREPQVAELRHIRNPVLNHERLSCEELVKVKGLERRLHYLAFAWKVVILTHVDEDQDGENCAYDFY